jgi:thioredoxin 1
MSGEPIHVTDAAFETTVLKSQIPVIVDFWAPWCGPCKVVGPMLDKIGKEQSGKVVIAKVNTDENPEWAMKYASRVSRLLGSPRKWYTAALPEKSLRDIVNQFL